MRWLLRFVLVAVFAVPPAVFAQAYNTTRSVQGKVTDASGKPVAGAIVKLEDTRSLQIRSYITKDNGSYVFHGLSTNVDYQLKAEYHGHTGGSKMLSQFNSDRVAVIDLQVPGG